MNNHLHRLEKELDRIQTVQGKGCTVDYSLSDIYSDLTDIGESLKKIHAEKNFSTDEVLDTDRRYKDLLVRFESIVNGNKLQNKGMVLASERTIPEFFYRITARYRGFWRLFEIITTFSGIGIIAFTLIGLTYFSAAGGFPTIGRFSGGLPLIKASGFIAGLVVGLFTHEFAHGVVLANNGIKITQAGLMAGSMVGGFIEADETTFFQADREVHLRFNASSIGTNALLAVIFGVIAVIIHSRFLFFIALGNLFFGFINSFPICPLDGGWVYEDLIKIYVKNTVLKKIFLSVRYAFAVLWLVLFTYSVLYHS